MSIETMHPEDVKAAIRKRHGSLKAFVRLKDLPVTGVQDLLRGRESARVRGAVEEVLSEAANESMKLDRSSGKRASHRKIAGAK